MKAVVVGGAGFLGSHLVDRLLADGDTVDVIDDLSTGRLANLAEARASGGEVKIHHMPIGSPEASQLIGMRQPDVIYHLVAMAGSDDSSRLNALGDTLTVCEAARTHGVPKIVTALPAIDMYGQPASRSFPIKELPIEPRGIKGIVARSSVDLLTVYRDEHAVEFTALAFTEVYGPRQRPESGTVAEMFSMAARREAPTLPGDGRFTRDYLFIDDAIDALARAGVRGSGLVINVGTGELTPMRDVWQVIGGSHGAEPVCVASTELPRFAVSPVRARIHLQWSPWTTLAQGLAATAGTIA